MQKAQGHVVVLALPLWGHTKPLCALLGKIVRARRVHATLFTSLAITARVLEEIGRQFVPEGEVELRKLIRVHSLPCSPTPLDFDAYEAAFIERYTDLYEGKHIPSSRDSDVVDENAERPRLVILDPLAFRSLKGIRHVSGSSVPIYAWHYGAVSALIYLCGPESMGGNGDLAGKISKIGPVEAGIRNRKIEAIFRRNEGKIISIPGMPPMYDYEYIPQTLSIRMPLAEVAILFQYTYRFFSDCDGVINNTCQFYEPSPLNALQEWLDARPILCLGPLLSPFRDTEALARSPDIIRVQAFLDAVFEMFGANSLVYVSFGTLLWPETPEYLWIIIDVLIEMEIPFILSHASPVASIPEEVAARVERAKIGYMAPWLPQEFILHHKACGWFMSHCGHNSVMESLDAGVPLICWPFLSDQPSNAANISSVHNLGYELFEVRSGPGLNPIRRLGDRKPKGTIEAVRYEAMDVLRRARGDDGRLKREKARWFSEQIRKSWEEGGTAVKDLCTLVDVLG